MAYPSNLVRGDVAVFLATSEYCLDSYRDAFVLFIEDGSFIVCEAKTILKIIKEHYGNSNKEIMMQNVKKILRGYMEFSEELDQSSKSVRNELAESVVMYSRNFACRVEFNTSK